MHSAMLAEKRLEEQNKMVKEASAIGVVLGIDDAAERLDIPAAGDPRLRQLYQDQAHSSLLTDIREALEAGESAATDDLENVVSPDVAETLRDAGIRTATDLRAASDEDLEALPGIGKATVQKMRQALGQE